MQIATSACTSSGQDPHIADPQIDREPLVLNGPSSMRYRLGR
jgi:hypothetical protein